MTYILKNTSGLINTRVTDTGRQKMSEGNFKISYFQIGDSEVSYDKLSSNYNQYNTFIFEPNFNTQNSTGVPESNKQSIKYPYYVSGSTGTTYGLPTLDSTISPIYNTTPLRGFFTGNTTANTIVFSALTNSQYVVSANYIIDMGLLTGSNTIDIIYSGIDYTNERKPEIGDFVTIYYDGNGLYDCQCSNLPTPTPTPTPTKTPSSGTTTTTTTSSDPCASPTATPTPTKTPCLTPTPSKLCPPPPPPNCKVNVRSCFQILTYRIIDVCQNTLTLDRPTPDFFGVVNNCFARILIYPQNMQQIYDSITPYPHWGEQVIDFESICNTDQFDVKIWNMNIPWTESPAGLIETAYEGYNYFGSIDYVGSKEYLGYNSSSGQTDTGLVYYRNSFGEIILMEPEEQKSIAIIHYTNQTIDFFYGEKFALEPFNVQEINNTNGQARNFKLHIPWLMWHKNPECCFGQTFWVDPPGFDDLFLFQPYYIQSKKNEDMNLPGLRYYNLWDTNPNTDGIPNRVGKVFPDQKIIVIDDEEIIASMSYKSNRNWTLPSPQLSLITPNTCGTNTSNEGILTGDNQTLYVTYRFTNDFNFTNSLHCNYYPKISGNNPICNPTVSQNVTVRFGSEFNCLGQGLVPVTTTTTTLFPITTTTTTFDPYTTTTTTSCPVACEVPQGYFAERFEIICQLTTDGQRPNSSNWKIIDYTDLLNSTTINGYLTQSGITGTTFVITKELYENAPFYNLNQYIPLTSLGTTTPNLNFGDEFYFYGSFETDIQATIYEMRYKINLGYNQFVKSSNPSWSGGTNSYVTEIALLDEDKDILVMSKLQSPVLRQGIQQYLVKLDF